VLSSAASDAAQGALNVVTDPCLFTVGQLLHRLNAAEQPSNAPTVATLGIGLCKVVPVIRAVVYLRERPWVAAAGIAGFLGLFVGIGYRIGQRRSAKP